MRVQTGFVRIASAILITCLAACTESMPEVQPGVSLELAEQRAVNISDIHYALAFGIPASENEDIDGEISISFTLADASTPLQLDFRESSTHIISVSQSGEAVPFDFRDEHIVIPASHLVAGENRIDIEFVAGSSSLNRNPEYLYTLFVPDRARTAFPLFDQPDLKAKFSLTLRVPPDWTAMSNASIDRIHYDENGAEFRFQASDLISSYLFSFVAGKFESITRNIDGRTMTMLHRETDEAKVARNVDEIFNLHAAALDWLEEYTGIEYPYQKFGFALIPAFQYGGMEHVGAIQYRASSLLLDEAPSQTRLLSRAGLIAHETAHMWFGNLVTMAWFNDVWTKEVFASFMAAKLVNPSFPEVNHDLNFLVRHYPGAYSVDRTSGANPIRQYLPNLNEAGQMYGAIIYNKAPIMMRHLEELIGEEMFREGMQEYLQRFAFSNATWPALIEILDRKSDEDLAAWSEVWVERPGRDGIQARWEAAGQETGDFRYGLVPADASGLAGWAQTDEVSKAALLLNLNEQMLAGSAHTPAAHLALLLEVVESEQNPLVLDLALGQLQQVYWRLLPDAARREAAPLAERVVLDALQAATRPDRRKVYFDAYANIATTPAAIDRVMGAWSGSVPIDNLPLSENDRIDLAQTLAIARPADAGSILETQIAQTENPDNVRKLRFIAPSLSPGQDERDRFFASLSDERNRQTEAWVLDALGNLHHPLRTAESEKYLLPSLELLQQIQVTGDIFFPKRWLDATLRNYRSDEAVTVVRQFLEQRPDYNEQLKMKILQSADMMFRANELTRADRAR